VPAARPSARRSSPSTPTSRTLLQGALGAVLGGLLLAYGGLVFAPAYAIASRATPPPSGSPAAAPCSSFRDNLRRRGSVGGHLDFLTRDQQRAILLRGGGGAAGGLGGAALQALDAAGPADPAVGGTSATAASDALPLLAGGARRGAGFRRDAAGGMDGAAPRSAAATQQQRW
jgi:hypothetical protein